MQGDVPDGEDSISQVEGSRGILYTSGWNQAEAGIQPPLYQPSWGTCGCQRRSLVLICAQKRCPKGTLEASIATVQDSFSRRHVKRGKKFGQKRTSLGEGQERNCHPHMQFCLGHWMLGWVWTRPNQSLFWEQHLGLIKCPHIPLRDFLGDLTA